MFKLKIRGFSSQNGAQNKLFRARELEPKKLDFEHEFEHSKSTLCSNNFTFRKTCLWVFLGRRHTCHVCPTAPHTTWLLLVVFSACGGIHTGIEMLSRAGFGHLGKGWIVRGTTARRLSYWANGLFYSSWNISHPFTASRCRLPGADLTWCLTIKESSKKLHCPSAIW